MSETRNIVILGASFAGLSAAHYLARHTLPKLQKSKDFKYEVHLIDPSTHFWWHIGAPRAIVSVKEMKHSDTFIPIKGQFDQYPGVKDSVIFTQGTATGLDTASRIVAIQKAEGGELQLPYYALIIATGSRSQTACTTLQGDHTLSQKALEDMNAKLAAAKDIVIGGGGPVGVETAGELATHLPKAKITLVTGADKLLPVLSKARSEKAQKMLEKVGVKVVYNARVTSTEGNEVHLSTNSSLPADVYIPATGMTPNTEFLPADLKDSSSGLVRTNPSTLRVDVAGARVYAVGDVSGVNTGGILNLYAAFPVAGANISHDLLVDAKLPPVPEKSYTRKDSETQIVPVGAKQGVGAFNGWGMPGFAISMVKGKDYMLSQMPKITQGKQWTKA